MTLDLAAYLDRIGYAGPVEPTGAVLAELHWRHLQTVPFENLDIRPLHRSISLELAAIAEKVIRRRRGGFCFELNSLLAAALREIGFATTMIAVQLVFDDGSLSTPFDHMALLVQTADGPVRYLADVGCGNDSPARPLPLAHDRAVTHAETGVACRLLDLGDRWRYDRRDPGGEWTPSYFFTPTPRVIADFADRCRYFDSDPSSYFVQGPICSRLTPEGRITVTGDRLIVTRGAARSEQELDTPEAFAAALREHFGIEL